MVELKIHTAVISDHLMEVWLSSRGKQFTLALELWWTYYQIFDKRQVRFLQDIVGEFSHILKLNNITLFLHIQCFCVLRESVEAVSPFTKEDLIYRTLKWRLILHCRDTLPNKGSSHPLQLGSFPPNESVQQRKWLDKTYGRMVFYLETKHGKQLSGQNQLTLTMCSMISDKAYNGIYAYRKNLCLLNLTWNPKNWEWIGAPLFIYTISIIVPTQM